MVLIKRLHRLDLPLPRHSTSRDRHILCSLTNEVSAEFSQTIDNFFTARYNFSMDLKKRQMSTSRLFSHVSCLTVILYRAQRVKYLTPKIPWFSHFSLFGQQTPLFLDKSAPFGGLNVLSIGWNDLFRLPNELFCQQNASFVGKSASFVGKNGSFVGKNGSFGGKNASFVGKSASFVGKNASFVGKNGSFGGKNASFGGKSASFVGKNASFVGKNGSFGGKNESFLGKNEPFLGKNNPFIGKIDIKGVV
jgi:hypothetical protein